MFSLQIVDSDAFLDMPQSSQLLYYNLAMRGDDDGFVDNPKKIMRMIGASEDDLKILIVKRFILTFESGVIVIKHWKIHNYIQNDRYKETKYLREKSQITIKDNGSYTERIQNVSIMDTEIRLGKDRLDKVSIERETPSQVAKNFFQNPESQIQEFISKGLPEELIRGEIKKFIAYWTEPTKLGNKERWEIEKTFEIGRRLTTWFSRIKDFNKFSKTAFIT